MKSGQNEQSDELNQTWERSSVEEGWSLQCCGLITRLIVEIAQ